MPDCVTGFVLLPTKRRPAVKVDKPVPPTLTVNVSPVTFEAFKFVKPVPDPLNKLPDYVPVAFKFVVSIPFRAYIIPLNDVVIARENAYPVQRKKFALT